MATVSMTVQPHITAATGVPRAVHLRYPAGNQLGEAGKPIQQRTILRWALEAAAAAAVPGVIVELPYRWRRFPVAETPVFAPSRAPVDARIDAPVDDGDAAGESRSPRPPQTGEIAAALDAAIGLAQEYRAWLEGRAAQEAANPCGEPLAPGALREGVERADRLLQILEGDALDQLREIVNRTAVMELMLSGKFV